ncbi:3775_t:CDS:10, partial [Ambispora gerdemannii]
MLKAVSSALTTQNNRDSVINTPTTTYANLHAPSSWPPTRPYNGSHGAIYAVPWFSPACEIIGALTLWTMRLNSYLFFVVAISTYLRVCRRIQFDYGKYDYKLFLIVFVLATMITSLQAIKGLYGAERWWCAGKNGSNAVQVMGFITQGLIIGLIGFSYFRILVLLAHHRPQLRERLDHDSFCNLKSRVTRNIARYILLFLLQWLPICIYAIAHVNGNEEAWTYVVVVIGVNFGGITNAIQYIINEGFSHKTDSSNSRNLSNNTIQGTKCSDYAVLEKVAEFLKPFKDHTVKISASLNWIIPLFSIIIIDHVEDAISDTKTEIGNGLVPLLVTATTAAREKKDLRMTKLMEQKIYMLVITPTPNNSFLSDTNLNNTMGSVTRSILDTDFDDEDEECFDEIESYISEKPANKEKQCASVAHQTQFPCHMAHDYLAIPASSVASERDISACGNMITNKMSSLVPKFIRASQYFRSWTQGPLRGKLGNYVSYGL